MQLLGRGNLFSILFPSFTLPSLSASILYFFFFFPTPIWFFFYWNDLVALMIISELNYSTCVLFIFVRILLHRVASALPSCYKEHTHPSYWDFDAYHHSSFSITLFVSAKLNLPSLPFPSFPLFLSSPPSFHLSVRLHICSIALSDTVVFTPSISIFVQLFIPKGSLLALFFTCLILYLLLPLSISLHVYLCTNSLSQLALTHLSLF